MVAGDCQGGHRRRDALRTRGLAFAFLTGAATLAVLMLAAPAHGDTFWGASFDNIGSLFGAPQLAPGGPNDSYTTLAVTNAGPTATTAEVWVWSGGAPTLATTLNIPVAGTTSYTLTGKLTGTGITRQYSYEVIANDPVVVSQFTPLIVGVSNDATRLLVNRQLGTDHYVFAYRDASGPYPAFVTVVGTQPGTTVTITSPVDIASAGIMANVATTYTLNDFETLNLEASVQMTGLRVESSAPVAVFGGNVCTYLENSACDHIDEQIAPVSMSGAEYILCSSSTYRTLGRDFVQVMALYGPTTFTVTHTRGLVETFSIPDKGQRVEFSIGRTTNYGPGQVSDDVYIKADNIISIAQYYAKDQEGARIVTSYNPGDPSMVIPTTLAALDTDHQLYTPETWVNTRAQIGAKVGSVVTIDGAPVVRWNLIGASGYQCAVQQINPGTHIVKANKPVDVTVMGIGTQGTYWYTTGGNNIPVIGPPQANFTYMPDGGCSLTVQFTDTSTPAPGGTIVTWAWKFGDGGTSTQRNPLHTYPNFGPWTVTLNVTQNKGERASATKVIQLCSRPPVADFTWETPPCAPAEMYFDDVSTHDSYKTATAQWSWGDGSAPETHPSPTQHVPHTYAVGGHYMVSLTVTDSTDKTNVATKEVVVCAAPVAIFSFDIGTRCPDYAVIFIDHSTDLDDRVVEWAWTFGDGAGSTEQDPVHAYAKAGSYDVSFSAIDQGHHATTVSKTVQARGWEECDFAASKPQAKAGANGDPSDSRDASRSKMDPDGDGIEAFKDNCQNVANADQRDLDHDGKGDACDGDKDGDTIPNSKDNCALVANANQADANLDGQGDACQDDADRDGVANAVDNCVEVPNLDQADLDHDGFGDVCDLDIDGDGVSNVEDLYPLDGTRAVLLDPLQSGTSRQTALAAVAAPAAASGVAGIVGAGLVLALVGTAVAVAFSRRARGLQ